MLSEHSFTLEHSSSHIQVSALSSLWPLRKRTLAEWRWTVYSFLQRATVPWSWWKFILPVIIQSTAKFCVNTNSPCQGNMNVQPHCKGILDFICSQNPMGDLIIWGGWKPWLVINLTVIWSLLTEELRVFLIFWSFALIYYAGNIVL